MLNNDLNHKMQNARCLQLLSVARRAGKLVFGEEKCLQAVRGHAAQLLLLDQDASQNTEKRFINACSHHGVPLWRFDRKALNVAQAVGRERNKTICLTDPGFFAKLRELEGLKAAAMSKGSMIAVSDSAQEKMLGVEV